MRTKNDNYMFLLLLLSLLVLTLDNHFYIFPSLWSHIFFHIVLLSYVILFKMCRIGIMTYNRLMRYPRHADIEYMYSMYEGLVDKIYVRCPMVGSVWYELDYSLAIHKDCTYREFQEFGSSHRQVSSLRRCMRNNLSYGKRFSLFIHDFYYMIFFILFEVIYWLIYVQI